jgi:hypothetical protein
MSAGVEPSGAKESSGDPLGGGSESSLTHWSRLMPLPLCSGLVGGRCCNATGRLAPDFSGTVRGSLARDDTSHRVTPQCLCRDPEKYIQITVIYMVHPASEGLRQGAPKAVQGFPRAIASGSRWRRASALRDGEVGRPLPGAPRRCLPAHARQRAPARTPHRLSFSHPRC